MEDNLLGKRDGLEVRLDLQQLGRQPELWPRNNQALPPAPWVFTLSGHKRASAWLASLRVPSAFNADPKRLFFMKQRSGDGPSKNDKCLSWVLNMLCALAEICIAITYSL